MGPNDIFEEDEYEYLTLKDKVYLWVIGVLTVTMLVFAGVGLLTIIRRMF